MCSSKLNNARKSWVLCKEEVLNVELVKTSFLTNQRVVSNFLLIFSTNKEKEMSFKSPSSSCFNIKCESLFEKHEKCVRS